MLHKLIPVELHVHVGPDAEVESEDRFQTRKLLLVLNTLWCDVTSKMAAAIFLLPVSNRSSDSTCGLSSWVHFSSDNVLCGFVSRSTSTVDEQLLVFSARL